MAHKEITATRYVCVCVCVCVCVESERRNTRRGALMPADYMNALCDVVNGSWRYLMVLKPGIM